MNKNTVVQISRIVISFLFVFGAISKLISMPFFDGMVAELFLGPDYFDKPKAMFWVQLSTRILVAAELVVGIALLQNKWFKSLVLPAALGILVLFTVHLFYEGFSKPNGFTEGNCGCFGDVLPMTNLESILKNVVGLVLGGFAWLWYRGQKFADWASPAMLGVVTMFTLAFGIKSYAPAVTPSVALTSDFGDSTERDLTLVKPEIMEETAAEELVELEETKPAPPAPVVEDKEDKPPVVEEVPVVTEEVRPVVPKTLQLFQQYASGVNSIAPMKGTKMVCLFSMSCSHCQEVYADICSFSESKKLPGMYLINYGTDYEQNYFFNQAGDCKHAHTLVSEYPNFKRMLEGKTYPRIVVFKDGKLAKEWDVDSYTKESFMNYFGLSDKDAKSKEDDGGLNLGGKSPW
jgi:hypothetical protein